jgi:hypothetical protein
VAKPNRKPLDIKALSSAAGPTVNPVDAIVHARAGRATQRSRIGKVQIQGYFPTATRARLKMLAARDSRTVEDLLAEAVEDLLRKHGG